MPRVSRYTTGARIEKHFLDLLELVYKSYYANLENKNILITTTISKIDILKYLIQIAWENKFIKDKPYMEISAKLQEIGKMLGGWKNNVDSKLTRTKQNPA